MSVFEIKGISIENQSVIMDISLTEGQVSENIYFLLNDFEETVNGDIISAKEMCIRDRGDWYDKLHKSTLTEALLDRIIHNRIDVYMGNENFRIKK